MKRASANYSLAMDKQFRDRSYAIVSLGIINADAQTTAHITSSVLYLSGFTNIFANKIDKTTEYATMEENTFRVDGTQLFVPKVANKEYTKLGTPVVTTDILGSLTVSYNKKQDILGFSINFTEFYPTKFKIVADTGFEKTYDNNKADFTCNDFFNGITSITIVPISFINGNNKRMRITSILMGVGITFTNDDITNLSLDDSCSFISEELPNINEKITCIDVDDKFNADNPNSVLPYLREGQKLSTYIGQTLANGEIEYVKLPVLYLTSWVSQNKQVSLTANDRLSTLKNKYTLGNTIHTRTLYDEAISIFKDAGLEPDEYTIDDCLQDIIIKNPMPEKTHAECLQLIANAGRCIIRQTTDGVISLSANFENITDPSQLRITTNSQAPWSKPDNVRSGASCVYADMTSNFFSANGTMRFLPKSANNYLATGYVSKDISDSSGNFSTPPSLTMELPASFSYYGLNMNFAGNVPTKMKVIVYNDDKKKEEFTVSPDSNNYYLVHDFIMFDKIEFSFPSSKPYNRVVINKISFGNITDYVLKYSDMQDKPSCAFLEKVKDVSVRICSYTPPENANEGPKLVDDKVYYTKTINYQGTSVVFENPLIGDETLAQQVAEWLGNYYNNNVTYQVNYRGDPRIDSADIIFMDNDYLNNLQVSVEKHSLKFNGALSGKLDLHREINMT